MLEIYVSKYKMFSVYTCSVILLPCSGIIFAKTHAELVPPPPPRHYCACVGAHMCSSVSQRSTRQAKYMYSTLLVFSLFRRVVYASATLVTDFTRSLQHLANHGP
jgi:hypothetical protein